MGPKRWWRPVDPGRSSLRRAARAAIVTPPVVAFVDFVLDEPDGAIYAAFSVFALLVFSDFSGSLPRRAGAYVITTAIGAMLIAVATVLSPAPVVAALGMVAVAFAARFATVYGGAFSAAAVTVILAWALGGSYGGEAADVPVRVLGWGIGGAAATIAALVLWPSFPRGEDRRRLARATRGLAQLIDACFGSDDPAAIPIDSEALRVAVETPVQSFGPSARDRALVFLSHETARLLALLEAPRPVASLAVSDAAGELRRVASDTLSASADALDGGTGSIPLRALRDERDRYATAVDDWAQRELTRGTDPGEVLDRLGADYELRSAALGALIIGVNAGMVAGREAAPDVVEDHAMPIPRRSTGASALQIAGAQWHGDSVVMRNSIRAGVGLGLTILVGGLVGVEHAFWVTLAAVTVLRSNAVGTGHTALQALAGTVAGFVVAAGLIIVVDDRSTVLWVVLPILVFLAAYLGAWTAPRDWQQLLCELAAWLGLAVTFAVVADGGRVQTPEE